MTCMANANVRPGTFPRVKQFLQGAEFTPKCQFILRYNNEMRIKPILFFGVVGLIAGYLVYKQADPNEVKVGKPAPDVMMKDQSGKQMKLSELRGNLVFLNV